MVPEVAGVCPRGYPENIEKCRGDGVSVLASRALKSLLQDGPSRLVDRLGHSRKVYLDFDLVDRRGKPHGSAD